MCVSAHCMRGVRLGSGSHLCRAAGLWHNMFLGALPRQGRRQRNEELAHQPAPTCPPSCSLGQVIFFRPPTQTQQ